MAEIEIEYCVPCGFRDRAIDVERAILGALETELDRVSLVMGDHGVFRVSIDGQTVYDKGEDEFDVDRLVREVREHL
ncbi:MAG: Rdx family protein [Haloarculaceae archaeon]